MNFAEFGLAEPFLRATQSLGYVTATPIQAKAIPVVLSGRDLIGCAQTGTGKTAAFTLPILDRLVRTLPERPATQSSRRGPRGRATYDNSRLRALVLSPTRELAAQIGDSMRRYGRFTPLRHAVVFGGVSQHHQVKAIQQGVDTIVATPGRLLDLMEQGHINLSRIEVLVLDEADQMLDMGFLPSLKRIIAAVPRQRQTLMFSATMPSAIRQLASQWLSDPVQIEVGPVATPVEQIDQSVHLVDKTRKPDLLSQFLKMTPTVRTLVFSRTKHGADKIVKRLTKDGIHATAIHGNKSQAARTRTLAQFKSKRPPVLVATDVAARGLDINNVSHVVNFDLPDVPEMYIHRIGRTGRAGATGVAVSFCSGDEIALLEQIELLTRQTIFVEPTIAGFELTDPIGDSRKSKGRRPHGPGHRGGKRPPKNRPPRSSPKVATHTPTDQAPGRSEQGAKVSAGQKRRKTSRRRYHAAKGIQRSSRI